MHYLDPTNKLFIFIGWWASYPPFFKGNLEKTTNFTIVLKKGKFYGTPNKFGCIGKSTLNELFFF